MYNPAQPFSPGAKTACLALDVATSPHSRGLTNATGNPNGRRYVHRFGENRRISEPLSAEPRTRYFLRFQPLRSTGHTHPHTRKLITWARTWSHAANSGASDVPAVPSRANGGTAFCSCCSTLLRGRRRTRRAARRTQHQGRLRQLPQVRLDSRCSIGAMGPASEGSGRQQKIKSWVADWLAFDARTHTHVGSLRRYITNRVQRQGRGCERARTGVVGPQGNGA